MFPAGKIVLEWDERGHLQIHVPIGNDEQRKASLTMLAEAIKAVANASTGGLLLPAPAVLNK